MNSLPNRDTETAVTLLDIYLHLAELGRRVMAGQGSPVRPQPPAPRKGLVQCPTCPRQMREGSSACYACRAVAKAAIDLERRRARYAEEIAHLERYISLFTISDADYEEFFRDVPRDLIDKRRQEAQGRLDLLRDRCGLTAQGDPQ